jgi:hypothetical protein
VESNVINCVTMLGRCRRIRFYTAVTATFTNLRTSYVVVRKAISDTISKARESDALPIEEALRNRLEVLFAKQMW